MNRSGLIVDLVDRRSGEKEGTMNDKQPMLVVSGCS